jgi:hypothetical protein
VRPWLSLCVVRTIRILDAVSSARCEAVVREVAAVFGAMAVLDITTMSRNARMPASSTQFKFFRGSLPQRVQRAILAVSRSEHLGQMLDSAMMNGCRAVRVGGLDRVPGQFRPFARVPVADSSGFELPESLKDMFPGAGGSAAQTGTKIQGV